MPPATKKTYSVAMKATREADLVIACVGERGIDCGESRSVSDINLPRGQERFLRIATSNGNKPTVMVLFNSRPLTFPWANENMQAILVAWQPGYETGNALVDILTGKVNPLRQTARHFPTQPGSGAAVLQPPEYRPPAGTTRGKCGPAVTSTALPRRLILSASV
jgi:hypothetical protein